MGRRWFLQVSGGIGVMNPVRSTYVLPTRPQPVANASLGYRTLSHTFLGSYSRAVSDSYGLGASFHIFDERQLAVGPPRPFLVDR